MKWGLISMISVNSTFIFKTRLRVRQCNSWEDGIFFRGGRNLALWYFFYHGHSEVTSLGHTYVLCSLYWNTRNKKEKSTELECNAFLLAEQKSFFPGNKKSFEEPDGAEMREAHGLFKTSDKAIETTRDLGVQTKICRHWLIFWEEESDGCSCGISRLWGGVRLDPGQKEKAVGYCSSTGTRVVRLAAWTGPPNCHQPSTWPRSLWSYLGHLTCGKWTQAPTIFGFTSACAKSELQNTDFILLW